MILGIGTDLFDLRRMEKLFGRFGQKLVQRLLTPTEQEHLVNPAQTSTFLGKRFAAKEACAKALGCGIGTILSFQKITVFNTPSGKPRLCVDFTSLRYLWPHLEPKKIQLDLSLTDEYPYTQAFVIASYHDCGGGVF